MSMHRQSLFFFFLHLHSIPLCDCTVCGLFSHFPISVCLVYFQSFAGPAMNNLEYLSFLIVHLILYLYDRFPEVGLLDEMVNISVIW